MKKACEILQCKFISVKSRFNTVRKIVKYSIRAATQIGSFGLCIGCEHGYRSVIYKYAIKYNIPLIFWGESQLEATGDMEKKACDAYKPPSYSSKLSKLFNLNFYLVELPSILEAYY